MGQKGSCCELCHRGDAILNRLVPEDTSEEVNFSRQSEWRSVLCGDLRKEFSKKAQV